MSWLFGLRSNPPSSTYPPESTGENSGDDGAQPKENSAAKKTASEAYRFDSSALERAAQAAKELEKSSKNQPSTLFCRFSLRENLFY